MQQEPSRGGALDERGALRAGAASLHLTCCLQAGTASRSSVQVALTPQDSGKALETICLLVLSLSAIVGMVSQVSLFRAAGHTLRRSHSCIGVQVQPLILSTFCRARMHVTVVWSSR